MAATNVVPIWGKPNLQRGRANLDKARIFIKDFPPDTVFDRDKFGAWAADRGYLIKATRSDDDAQWLLYLRARQRLLQKIRKGGGGPQMRGVAPGPFRIKSIGQTVLQVELLNEDHIVEPQHCLPIRTMIANIKRRIAWEFQSAEWENIPNEIQKLAEFNFTIIGHMEEDMHKQQMRLVDMVQGTLRSIKEARAKLAYQQAPVRAMPILRKRSEPRNN